MQGTLRKAIHDPRLAPRPCGFIGVACHLELKCRLSALDSPWAVIPFGSLPSLP